MVANNGVTVIGSYNVGLFFKGQRLPERGETITANSFHEGGGGKGSNQAIAASLFGAETTFVGRIGSDKYGKDALAMYKQFGMSTDYIQIDKTIHTGIGPIIIDKEGNNLIAVVPGANFNLCDKDIDKAEEAIMNSSIVGFQLENNFEVVESSIRKIHSMGIKTLLDPAPAIKLPDDIYPYIDIIKPNETEAAILTGIEVRNKAGAEKAAHWLIDRGVTNAIITLGGQGVVSVTAEQTKMFDSPKVNAIDTTGAGDIFSGALMAGLSKGKSIEEAIIFANHAAALSVTKLGVIEAIPSLEEVEEFIKSYIKEGCTTCSK